MNPRRGAKIVGQAMVKEGLWISIWMGGWSREWGCGAETFGPWSRLEADCACLYWTDERELRRLGVHLGSLICRRFGMGH